MRLRLPGLRTGDPAIQGDEARDAGSSTDLLVAGGGEKHGTVQDEKTGKRWWAVGGVRTLARSLHPLYLLYRGAAERYERLSRRWWWLPSWTFAAVTQLPALLAIAWLVPGIGMLLAGRLLPTPMLIMFVPVTVALCYFAMRLLPLSWPRFGVSDDPAAEGETERARADVPLGALLATVAIAAGFGVWQAVFRSEQVFTAGDPSVYLQYGYWIAEHGTAQTPTASADFGAFGGGSGLQFAIPGFFVSGGSITPGFLPGLPLVLAGGTWLGGIGGALLMPAVLGGCAVLSFGGLVGRLCGARWAPAGALVLALALPQVYVSRTPMSEPLVQVLLFGGLCLFIDSLVVRRRGVGAHRVSAGSGDMRFGGLALAGLGGLALGLTVLADIGSLGVLLPAFPVLAVLFVVRRRQAGPLALGLFAGLGLGLAAALVLARPYLSTLSTQLHLFGYCAVGFGVLTALVGPLAFPSVRARLRRVFARRPRVLVGFDGEPLALPSLGMVAQFLAVVLPAVALVWLLLRPSLQTVRGQTNPTLISQVAELQKLAGLPVDGTRQYYEQTLDWVIWYLGIPAVILACAGTAVIGRRLVRGALAWRSSLEAARVWSLPFVVIIWSVATMLWDPFVAPWQPWAAHRLVPVVFPGVVLLGVWVASRLTDRAILLGAPRVTVAMVSACCVLALGIPPLVTTLNPGLAAKSSVGVHSSGLAKLVSRIRLRGVGASSTYGGSLAAAQSLCSSIGQDASVVFVNAEAASEFAPVVRGMCDTPAATLATGTLSGTSSVDYAGSPAEAAMVGLEQAATSIEGAGRRPVLLATSSSSLTVFGVVPRLVVSLHTTQDAEVLTGPPAESWPATYTLWMASPRS